MHDVETEITEIAIAGGWRGRVAVRTSDGKRYSKSDWEKLLAEPEKLFEGTEKTLKVDGANTVTVKHLDIGGMGVKAVIKRRYRSGGIRGIFRMLGPAHSIWNFFTAVKVTQYELPAASPLAAIYHRKFLFCDQSIYLSGYAEGTNLYEFLRNVDSKSSERYRIMRELSQQMAYIFAELHRNNLWHRDAKATNFVVNRDNDGKYQVTITDVDGIKQYLLKSESRQLQGLWQLASTVMGLGGISRTDYLRTFKIYCEYAGIANKRHGDIYERLAEKAESKFRQRQARHGR
jgi:serine/threonine protein kinase